MNKYLILISAFLCACSTDPVFEAEKDNAKEIVSASAAHNPFKPKLLEVLKENGFLCADIKTFKVAISSDELRIYDSEIFVDRYRVEKYSLGTEYLVRAKTLTVCSKTQRPDGYTSAYVDVDLFFDSGDVFIRAQDRTTKG